MRPSILVVHQEPEMLVEQLNKKIGNQVRISAVTTGMDGLCQFRILRPMMIIIDNDLPDIYGMSVASIIKDTEDGPECLVYVLGIKHVMQNTKADFLIGIQSNLDIFCTQVHNDLQSKLLCKKQSEGMLKAIEMQNDMLPQPIQTDRFTVNSIFSSYDKLSGDGINYWYSGGCGSEHGNKDDCLYGCLYGFLFDCVGHDLSSYGQVGTMWISLRKGLKFFQTGVHKTLGAVMKEINDDFVSLYDYTNIVSAMTFCFDFNKNVLRYCPAAIPYIMVRYKGAEKRELILLKSFRLGYNQDSEFEEQSIPLDNLEEVVFLSDGLSDLIIDTQEPDDVLNIAKTDDVSAIFVRLNT